MSKTLSFIDKHDKERYDLSKPLLVLDLDECLIYCHICTTENEKSQYKNTAFDWIFIENNTHYVFYKRPHLNEFLNEVSKYFQIAIWSSTEPSYIDNILNNIFPEHTKQLAFAWSKYKAVNAAKDNFDFSSEYKSIPIKDLIKLRRKKSVNSLNKVLFVDDSPYKLKRNYGNLITVNKFEGELNDNELLHLKKYLLSIKDCENYRNLEKRNWIKNYV
jgi:TFIIF-interacting CTD phosphatase-like protein